MRRTRNTAEEICEATLSSHGLLTVRGAKVTALDVLNINLGKLPTNAVRESTDWAAIMKAFVNGYHIEPIGAPSRDIRPRAPAQPTECERRIAGLVAAGVVQRLETSGARLKVHVGSGFYGLTYDQREAIASLLNDCIAEAAGSPGGGVRFDIVDGYSGDRIYRWEYYKLKR